MSLIWQSTSLHLQHTRKVGLVSFPKRGIGGIKLALGRKVGWGRESKNGLRTASRPVMCRLEFRGCRGSIIGQDAQIFGYGNRLGAAVGVEFTVNVVGMDFDGVDREK